MKEFAQRFQKLRLELNQMNFIVVYLSLLFATALALAQDNSPSPGLPISFPTKLISKAEVNFPLNGLSMPNELPSQFIRFVNYVKVQCIGRYHVHYYDYFGIHYNAEQIFTDINLSPIPDKLKITCALPVITDVLNSAGTRLHKSSSKSKHKIDLPSVLAAGALDVDFNSFGEAPGQEAIFFTMIRLISRSWPYILAETDGWAPSNEIASRSTLRQMKPWLTEFSSFSALSQFQADLPCQSGSSTNCEKLKSQISKVLQVTLNKVNGAPKVQNLLASENSILIRTIPNLKELKVLDTLVRAVLATDNGDLSWSDSGPILNPESTWLSIMSVTRSIKIVTRYVNWQAANNIHNTAVDRIDEQNEFIKQLASVSYRNLIQAEISNVDSVAFLALKTGFEFLYRNKKINGDQDFLRHYINLKRFLDIQKTAKRFSIDKCVQCLEEVSPLEYAGIEKLVREMAQMVVDITALTSRRDPEIDADKKTTQVKE